MRSGRGRIGSPTGRPCCTERLVDASALAPFAITDESLRVRAEAVLGLLRVTTRRDAAGNLTEQARQALEELGRAAQRAADGILEPEPPSREAMLEALEASVGQAIQQALADRPIQPTVSFGPPPASRDTQ